MAYDLDYDDRTTGYDPRDTYGRHDLRDTYGRHDTDAAYDDEYGVSHSHSYSHPDYDYPATRLRSQRRAASPTYEYAHGEYDYPTGIEDGRISPLAPSSHHAYDSDRFATDDGGYGAGAHGRSSPSGYGSGRSQLDDVWLADEKHRPVRDERPMLIGSIFCFLAFAVIGVVTGIMLAVVFIRPPTVGVAGYPTVRPFIQDQALWMNTTVYAGVVNPNAASAKLKTMHAKVYERDAPEHSLATSDASNIGISANGNTTLILPATIQLLSAQDFKDNTRIVTEIVKSCDYQPVDLAEALGTQLPSNFNRRDSVAMYDPPSKRDGQHLLPLLIALDVKFSFLSLNFHAPINCTIECECRSPKALLVGNGDDSSSSSSSIASSSSISSSATSSSSVTPSSSSSSSSTPAPTTAAPTSSNAASQVSSIMSNDPSVSSSVEGNPFWSSVISQGEGAGNAVGGLFSFITAGSMPIRRAEPTAVPVA